MLRIVRQTGGYWAQTKWFGLVTTLFCTKTDSLNYDIKYLRAYGQMPTLGSVLYVPTVQQPLRP